MKYDKEQIKGLLSRHLRGITIEAVVRELIFSHCGNRIDWDAVAEMIISNMPELREDVYGYRTSPTCVFCGDDVDLDQGDQALTFFANNKQYCDIDQAVCPNCVDEHLYYDDDCGEYELLNGHALPREAKEFAAHTG